MSKKILIQSFSSGIDSTTTIYKAINEDDFDLVVPINYIYGQKNIIETINQFNLFEKMEKTFGDKITNVVTVNIEAMFSNGMDFYKLLRDSNTIKEKTGTEYYTPMRNLLFSTIASMLGELYALHQEEEVEIYIGIGVHKHSDIYEKDYWDITPEFVNKLDQLFALNDNISLKLYAPYKDKTKTELVKNALELNVPYRSTWTCYNPSEKDGAAIPCLECESCKERELAFNNNNIMDGNNYMVQLDEE